MFINRERIENAMRSLTKMIVVDDDKDILTIIQYCLEGMSEISIKYCQTAQEAIQEALVFLPDLMLVDVMMPGMDGIAMVEAMRLMPSLANIPVVFVTAKIQKEEIDSYFKLGVADVITKPFDPIGLPETIQKIWLKINRTKEELKDVK